MKKRLEVLLVLSLLFFNFALKGQEVVTDSIEKRNQGIYFELGGSAIWYSLNYERKITLSPNKRLALGVGGSLIPIKQDPIFSVLFSGSYLYGIKHNLELGFSPMYSFADKDFFFSVRIGYRYDGKKGFTSRVGLSPTLIPFNFQGFRKGRTVIPWAYLSVGYSF